MAPRDLTSIAVALGLALRLGCVQASILLDEGLLSDSETCPGSLDVAGYGPVEIVATKWNVPKDPASKVEVLNGQLTPNLKGRAYFADACNPGVYNHQDYIAPNLLGKALRFTVNLSALGCGCNGALYLTNLKQNSELSGCQDYYCDANSVCGVMCPEIDVMEANSIAWHSTLHEADDRFGIGGGYGGGGPGWNGARDWTSSQYGPGGSCVDTNHPFQVEAAFPLGPDGVLAEMRITLSQDWHTCKLQQSSSGYDGNTSVWAKGSKHGMAALTEALQMGMTPIASLWQSEDMMWMDGKGDDGLGPCEKDLVDPCPTSFPMYDFSIAALPPPPPPFAFPAWTLIVGLVLVALAVGIYLMCCGKGYRSHEDDSATASESE